MVKKPWRTKPAIAPAQYCMLHLEQDRTLRTERGALAGYLNCALHCEVWPFWLTGGRYGLRVLETFESTSLPMYNYLSYIIDCSWGPGHV